MCAYADHDITVDLVESASPSEETRRHHHAAGIEPQDFMATTVPFTRDEAKIKLDVATSRVRVDSGGARSRRRQSRLQGTDAVRPSKFSHHLVQNRLSDDAPMGVRSLMLDASALVFLQALTNLRTPRERDSLRESTRRWTTTTRTH